MGEHRRNHGDRQELGGDRTRGEDPGRSVAYDRRRDGDNIERDRPGGRERRRSGEWELGGDGREAGGGVERQGEEARVGRALNTGAVSLSAIKLGGRRGSGSGSVANISGRSGSFNSACEASATGMTGDGSPRYGGEGGKLRKGQDELAAARAALAEAAKAAAARVAGATDENRRWERFVALLE